MNCRFERLDRIVAAIEESDFGAQDGGGFLRLSAPGSLDAFERHTGLLPKPLGFAPLAIGKAQNPHAVTTLGVQGNRAAGAPNEIRSVRAKDDDTLARLRCHNRWILLDQCARVCYRHAPDLWDGEPGIQQSLGEHRESV